MQSPSTPPPTRSKLITALIETFGFSPWLASIVAVFLLLLGAAALAWIWLSAPPAAITITSGPPGSTFQKRAEEYQRRLATHGVTLKIVSSGGSLDNLKRLLDPASGVDIGFVQGGLVPKKVDEDDDDPPAGIVSLGTTAYQPLWVFYRGPHIDRLAELAGKRIGIGAPGSGVQPLARAMLALNGLTGAPTTLVDQPSEAAAKAFQAGQLDAIFLTGDSAPTGLVRTFLAAADVQALSFAQADAYVRRLSYLNKIVIPRGGINLGENMPAQDITLLAPNVELIARKGLNSAISDLLLDVAQHVHGRASLLAKQGEFPAPIGHEYAISADALRFYKSGKGITYNLVDSFWLANLINRLLLVIVPLLLVLIPAIRFLPVVYRWSVQLRIYRCYRPLLRLERDAETPLTGPKVEELLERLDGIESDVNKLKVPASFASQFYDLRNHVVFVRNRLKTVAAR